MPIPTMSVSNPTQCSRLPQRIVFHENFKGLIQSFSLYWNETDTSEPWGKEKLKLGE